MIRAKYFENSSYIGGYPNYWEFCRGLIELLKKNVINVHTLNHDLLFDLIGQNVGGLWEYFTDGFTEMNSALYGDIRHSFHIGNELMYKTYKVRVPVYQENFSNRLRLFKLHGSVDYYNLSLLQTRQSIVIKRDYGVTDIYKEHYDERIMKFAYEQSFSRNYPLFLTGKKEKIKGYSDPFFKTLITHFNNNLQCSSHLIVIGYGFQDDGINEMIEFSYLKKGKSVLVIDIVETKCDLVAKYKTQFNFCIGSVEHVGFKEYINFVDDVN